MLQRLFIFILFTISCLTNAHAATFPKYQEVVETLIHTTDLCAVNFGPGTKLNIEKRIDGYWVSIATWDLSALHYDFQQRQLFWTAKEQKYNVVQFTIKGADNTTISNQHLLSPYRSDGQQDPYNVHLFYGYNGWYQEVIKWYASIENQRTLEDFECYSLGRAYSDYAKILLSDPGTVYYALSEDFLSTDVASSERIHLYQSISDKAIHYFYQTHLQNPNWSTITGNIFTKYSNEVVIQYQNLASHVKHKEALKVFKNTNLYTEATLAFASNMLKSCPPNAILWTYGDNTSLPMFYLQQVHKVRPDVLVTDAYQLSLWRYIDYVQNKKIHDNPITLPFDPTLYYKNNNDYILVNDNDKYSKIDHLQLILEKENEVKTFESKTIQLPLEGEKQLSIEIKGNYLIKNEWISLFIWAYNQRPLCFLYDFKMGYLSFTKNLAIKEQLHPFGTIYRLDHETYTIPSDEEIEKRYDIITKDLEWPLMETIAKEDYSPFNQYMWSVIMLANDLHNSDKNHQVIALLEDFRSKFPLDTTATSFNNLFYFIDLYFKAAVPSKAELLIATIFEGLLAKKNLDKTEFRFVQQVDTILQKQKIDKFNKIIQQLYLKYNNTPTWE
ncbi:hypothetical protein [Aureispira sp. CCB-E]|uniref:hypothetical protein n=1 Tax=Aureispira sp. CCB-E TaxID=3051121 RepID=UPI0028686FB3|nr:hypothetical protein [Aureispira sp. CCB-E]WMX17416.1 hypothetical protein QP953_13625 [Aureispira sp. CCB-E]